MRVCGCSHSQWTRMRHQNPRGQRAQQVVKVAIAAAGLVAGREAIGRSWRMRTEYPSLLAVSPIVITSGQVIGGASALRTDAPCESLGLRAETDNSARRACFAGTSTTRSGRSPTARPICTYFCRVSGQGEVADVWPALGRGRCARWSIHCTVGRAPVWPPRRVAPAQPTRMAAGLANHVWTLQERLSFPAARHE